MHSHVLILTILYHYVLSLPGVSMPLIDRQTDRQLKQLHTSSPSRKIHTGIKINIL